MLVEDGFKPITHDFLLLPVERMSRTQPAVDDASGAAREHIFMITDAVGAECEINLCV